MTADERTVLAASTVSGMIVAAATAAVWSAALMPYVWPVAIAAGAAAAVGCALYSRPRRGDR